MVCGLVVDGRRSTLLLRPRVRWPWSRTLAQLCRGERTRLTALNEGGEVGEAGDDSAPASIRRGRPPVVLHEGAVTANAAAAGVETHTPHETSLNSPARLDGRLQRGEVLGGGDRPELFSGRGIETNRTSARSATLVVWIG